MAQTFTISRTADKWYVSFAIKAEKVPPLGHLVATPIGIDLGVSTLCDSLRRQFLQISPPTQESENTALSKEQWRNRKK
jgi:putative transposase